MLDEVLPEVKFFLKQYKKDEWEDCLKSCLVYGAKSISKKYPFGLTIDQLSTLAGLTPKRGSATERTQGETDDQLNSLASLHSLASPGKKSTRKHFKKYKGKRSAPMLKTPSLIKEPNTCSLQDAQKYIKIIRKSHPKSAVQASMVMKIAEDFLNNPFTSYLIRNPANNIGSNRTIR